MNLMRCWRTFSVIAFVTMVMPFCVLVAQDRLVDFRYSPAYTHTPIGFPDDWQKTMVNERGELLLDSGPGPYVHANTVVGIAVKGIDLLRTRQTLERVEVPIVNTVLSGSGVRISLSSFALVPRAIQTAKIAQETTTVHRRLGLTGALAWAHPQGKVDPAFYNVAWGTNRPIVYEIGVKAGSSKRVALGICESYRKTAGLRAMELHVEGAPVKTIDPVATGGHNIPVVVFLDAKDVNRDGTLEIEARPSTSVLDPNVILNGVWVFKENERVTADDVIGGTATNKAEVYVDCGKEPELQQKPTRVDGLLATAEGSSGTLIVTVKTTRRLTFDAKSGILQYEGRPFIVSRPAAVSAGQTDHGWELELPKGARKAEVIAIHGYRLPRNISEVPDLSAELERTKSWWMEESHLPFGHVSLPDSQIQHLFDASVRTLYQNRDTVDGYPQFQPGSTVYRGLWLHDGVYYIEAAALLGDTLSARLGVEELFKFQEPKGGIRVFWPIVMQRETPAFLWIVDRYARLANNPDWLEAHWDHVVKAMSYMRVLREQTMADSSLSYYGLMPPGFMDGGIAGLTADYCTVYWSLIGIRSAIEMAEWLGKSNEQRDWQPLYDALLASFRKAAKRDVRHDRFGHPYLPLRVGDTTSTDVPQRAQWAIGEAIFLSSIFPESDSLAVGSLAMIDSACIEGIPSSFGWLTGGVGPWFTPLYGLAHLAEGNVDRAVDILYAFANHATPFGAWAEEQMPKGVSTRTTGDYPTSSATEGMLRSVLFYLAYEKESSVVLLRGIPRDWLSPGSAIRADDLRTKFGRISIAVTVSKNGKEAKIDLNSFPYGDADVSMAQYTDSANMLDVYLTSFKQSGFRDLSGKELSDRMKLGWGEKVSLELHRQGTKPTE
jgi:hypothetical protein